MSAQAVMPDVALSTESMNLLAQAFREAAVNQNASYVTELRADYMTNEEWPTATDMYEAFVRAWSRIPVVVPTVEQLTEDPGPVSYHRPLRSPVAALDLFPEEDLVSDDEAGGGTPETRAPDYHQAPRPRRHLLRDAMGRWRRQDNDLVVTPHDVTIVKVPTSRGDAWFKAVCATCDRRFRPTPNMALASRLATAHLRKTSQPA